MDCYELITIGGGAAGFFGSIQAAEDGALPCLILERARTPLTKVKISGGGRCNVTHQCFDPKELSKHYPRGHKSLIGPFHHFHASHTVDWFKSRGVMLKSESDGRMFPVTDQSQTVIDCLMTAAREAKVELRCQCSAEEVRVINPARADGARFCVKTNAGDRLYARNLLIASGGTRLAAGAKLASSLGHQLIPHVPSLFTFKIDHPLLLDLPGLSVTPTESRIASSKFRSKGPILITHWGLSGPGILKLSAWEARQLSACDYHFTLEINWLPNEEVNLTLQNYRAAHGKRQISNHCPFPSIPKRLWRRFVDLAGIPPETLWAQLPKSSSKALNSLLSQCQLPVSGQSLNKDEFVTAGGVDLKEVNLKNFESKLQPGLFFAGEVLNIDGVTGGFNFQNAWTSGFIAGQSIATNARS